MELIGIIMLGFSLILIRRQSVWGPVWAIIAAIPLLVYFASIGLYGQVTLRVIQILIAAAAIYSWRRGVKIGGEKQELQPSYLSGRQRILLVLAFGVVAGVASLGGLKSVLDWTSMLGSIVRGLLVIKKKTETWWIRLVRDSLRLPLFIMSGSYMTLFYTLFFAGNSVAAIRQWGRSKCV
jgi:nicotinamide mononucleotide transporter